MIVKEEFLAKLRRYFSLNLYEVKIWTALLSRGVSTAGELSDIANVPRSRSYDVLESLEKKGFIVMKIGKPIKYIAVPPSEVVERVKKKISQDTKEQISNLEKIQKSEILDELRILHDQGIELIDPTEFSGVIKNRSNLYDHIESAIKNANKSINMMTTAEGISRKTEILGRAFEKAMEKGVKIKILVNNSVNAQKAAKDLKGVAEIRQIAIKGRFLIADGKTVTLMVTDDSTIHPNYDAAIWSNSEFLALTLESLFDNAWKNSN